MNSARLKKLAKAMALFVIVSCIACIGWRLATRTPDPVCNGRRLSEWLPLIGLSNGVVPPPEQKTQATEAIQRLGTNAVPSLLAWMTYEPPVTRYHLLRVCSWLPQKVLASRPVQRLLADQRAMERAGNAGEALAVLGPQAAPAIPELTRRASRPWSLNPSAVRVRAMLTLAKLGRPALPALETQLSSPGGAGDLWVMSCVQDLGTNAEPLIPVIIKNLSHSDGFTAMLNARLLGELKLEPGLAIPALTRCLSDRRREVRMEAPGALMEFGGLAREALPALTNALRDADADVRRNAAIACQRISGDGYTRATKD